MPAPDPTRFHRHGSPPRLQDQTQLTHTDGTPFFYLADTAWNGPLLSTDQDWSTYLDDRAKKGFTAIQFITHAPWSAALADREGQTAFTNDPQNPLNENFFNRLDHKIAAINDRGLLAVPVLAWAANFGPSRSLNPGHTHTAKQLIPILRAQVQRLAKHQTLLLLAGDGVYNFWRARKWKRVARAVFNDFPTRPLVTLHPAGLTWPYARFKNEPWLDCYAYQSSHSQHPTTLTWLQSGPATRVHPPPHLLAGPLAGRILPPKPTLNLEPIYEDIGTPPADHHAVRRALYWSLLNAPTAGVAYGAHGLWSWTEKTEEPLNHHGLGQAQSWHIAMNFPASHQVAHLASLFNSINWWILRPDPTLIQTPNPPGPTHIAAARSNSGDLALIYLPQGQELHLDQSRLVPTLTPTWFNPRTGATHPADNLIPPDPQDWLLVLK